MTNKEAIKVLKNSAFLGTDETKEMIEEAVKTLEHNCGDSVRSINAEKVIKTMEPVSIEIRGITLLSNEQYSENRDKIPPHGSWWWLRLPYSAYPAFVGCVDYECAVNLSNVFCSGGGVSPALFFDLESSDLKIGDTVLFGGYMWTVISEEYIQCNDIICKMPFRKDWKASDANIYEKSDIKKFLERWLDEQITAYSVKQADVQGCEVFRVHEEDQGRAAYQKV